MTTKLQDVGATVTATIDLQTFELFEASTVNAVAGARVFDVGQGDCIGIRDQTDQVFCYVDYGGLADHPDAANPSNTATRMPVLHNFRHASIVLTHWDKDHYWSAKKKNVAAQQCPWIVPRQHASPTAVRFAARLPLAACWPETIGDRAEVFPIGRDYEIRIRKCKKFDASAVSEDRNVTGLVVTLHEHVFLQPDRMMIFPGDCAFDLIPNASSDPVFSLVAYHHGSATHWRAATSKAINNPAKGYRMVYSFGKNTYGHPSRSNYSNCTPDWDAQSVSTGDVRRRGDEFEDIDW